MADGTNIASTTSNIGNDTTVTAGVGSSIASAANTISSITGVDMSKWFAKPGTGTKTPATAKALKLKCQFGINFGLGLPDLPSIYLPKFPPSLPSIPIPLSLPLGPCTISLDLACLGIPDDMVQIAIKYIIIPIAGGIIPPKAEALAKVVGGKIAGVIEDAEEYAERYKEIQEVLNNLSLDAMFGLDAIPCPDQVQKAKDKAKADAAAAKKREEEGKLTREDIYNKYSDAILQSIDIAKSKDIKATALYSSIRAGKAIELLIPSGKQSPQNEAKFEVLKESGVYDATMAEIRKPITDWEAKYEN